MLLKLDLHIHSYHSFDSNSTIEDIAATALKKGLSGVAVTDHNTFDGTRELLKTNHSGLVVIPGAEYVTEKGHVLALFIRKGLDEVGVKPGARGIYDCGAVLGAIHMLGGIAILAHPFKKGSAKHDRQSVLGFDGIEAYNARAALKNIRANMQAGELAQVYSLIYTAGSDAHQLKEIGNAFLAVEVKDTKLDTVKRAVMMAWGDVYGTNAHRVSEAHSQILRGRRLKLSFGTRFRMRLGMLRAILIDLLRTARIRPKGFEGLLMKGGQCVALPYKGAKKE